MPSLGGREGGIHRGEGRGSQRLVFGLARLKALSDPQLEQMDNTISPLMWEIKFCQHLLDAASVKKSRHPDHVKFRGNFLP